MQINKLVVACLASMTLPACTMAAGSSVDSTGQASTSETSASAPRAPRRAMTALRASGASGISRTAPLSTAPMYQIPTSGSIDTLAPTTPSWSQTHGSTADDFQGVITADASGNILVAGVLAGPMNVGCGSQMLPTGLMDTFVAKYSPSGSCLWATHFGGTADGWPTSMVADASGNIYLSGTYEGTVNFGSKSITSTGGYDVYVAALSSTGTATWATTLGGASDDAGFGVALSGSNVYAVGEFTNSMTAGTTTLTNNGVGGGFVAALATSSGSVAWARTTGTGCELSAFAIIPTATGVAVGGAFRKTSDFGGGTVTSAGGVDGFVVAYGSTGTYQWSTTFGGTGDDVIGALVGASDGGVLATGYFTASASFTASTIPSLSGKGQYTGFAAKLNSSGAALWSRAIDATGLLSSNSIAVDANGDVLVTGSFEGTATLPGGTYAAKGIDDAFIAHYSSAGADIGAATYGGTGSAGGLGLVSPSTGVVAMTGYFDHAITIGSSSYSTVGGVDIFMLSSATP